MPYLRLVHTGKRNNSNFHEKWLKEGDIIEMSIEGLGKISNKIIKDNSNYQIK